MTIINTSEAIYITALTVAVSYICPKITSTLDMDRLPYEYNGDVWLRLYLNPVKETYNRKLIKAYKAFFIMPKMLHRILYSTQYDGTKRFVIESIPYAQPSSITFMGK